MRKFIVVALLLTVIMPAARAMTLEVGAEPERAGDYALSVDAVQLANEWNGEVSTTHKWIVICATFTNYALCEEDLSQLLSARLTYDGKYVFDAILDFEPMLVEPLVKSSGQLVFRVPNLVAEEDPSVLKCELVFNGEPNALLLSYRRAGRDSALFFDAPEQAIQYFAQCVAAGDFEGAMCASAATSIAEAFDLLKFVERLNVYIPYTTPTTLPSGQYDAYQYMNKIGLLNSFRQQLYGFITSLLFDEEANFLIENQQPCRLDDGALQIGENSSMPLPRFIEMYDPARLASLNLIRIMRNDSTLYFDDRFQENIKKQGVTHGFSDTREFVAIYEFDGERYAHTYTLVRFERGWQIYQLNAVFLGTAAYGTAERISGRGIDELFLSDGLNLTTVFDVNT